MTDRASEALAGAIASMQNELNPVVAARVSKSEVDVHEMDVRLDPIMKELADVDLADEYMAAPGDGRAALKIKMMALRDLTELLVALNEKPDGVLMVEVA
jgi:hypothetical protein